MRYQYLVEIGKGRGSYKIKYGFESDSIMVPSRALLHYNCLNTHSGYKKRLVRVDNLTLKRTVLARLLSA